MSPENQWSEDVFPIEGVVRSFLGVYGVPIWSYIDHMKKLIPNIHGG